MKLSFSTSSVAAVEKLWFGEEVYIFENEKLVQTL
jgi:hypothetical protein